MMIIFLLFLAFFFLKEPILAVDKNIFGLHLTQTSDIHSANKIINSSNGDWGWATIVIRTDQLNHQEWQEFFNNARKYHIIPIIRLATIIDQGNWKRPEISDIDNLANFLNSLNWPTQTQNVILFNEINHGSEWGGEVDVKNFTDISIYAAQKFKNLNPNFYILGGGFDLAAPEKPPRFKSALNVYQEIFSYRPEYFNYIDGIASHSYPNHGFIGTPNDQGIHSIIGYQSELSFLKKLNISKNFPIFITETGWPHNEGENNKNNFYTTKTTAKFLVNAFNIWSKDPNIKAVTPFIYNYPNPPFDHFSWLDKTEQLYPEYQQVIDLPKQKNKPNQLTKYKLTNVHLPFIILNNTDYSGQITLQNDGQSVWGETQFCLNPQTTPNIVLDVICTDNNLVYPGQTKVFNFKFKVTNKDHIGKTFISWTDIPPIEITPISKNSEIYRPKTGILEKLKNLHKTYLNRLIYRLTW